MRFRDRFEEAFETLKGEFKRKATKSFLDELHQEIEDGDFVDFFHQRRGEPKHVVVTFDRFDDTFRYDRFDILLVLLDALSGGVGIFKPTHQIRVIRWNSARTDLVKILEHFAKLRTELRFRGVVVLPCPLPYAGRRLQRNVYASVKLTWQRR